MALPIGWFSTGRDEAAKWLLKKTLEAIAEGFLPVEIAFVFCSREEGDAPESNAFLEFVGETDLPLVAFSSRRFLPELWRRGKGGDEGALREWRRLYHDEVYRRLSPYLEKVTVSLLAGYMLIVSDEFCDAHTMLNLHPALPGGPKGTWQEVIWQLIDRRAEEAGAQIHLVTPELDSGPTVSFCRVPLQTPDLLPLWDAWDFKRLALSPDAIMTKEGERQPLFAQIRRRQLAREVPLIHLTLKKLAEGEIALKNKKVFWRDKLCSFGLDLTDEVEALLEHTLLAGERQAGCLRHTLRGDDDAVGRF